MNLPPHAILIVEGSGTGFKKPLPIIEAIIGSEAFIGCGATSFPLTMCFVEGSRKIFQKPFPMHKGLLYYMLASHSILLWASINPLTL